MTKKARSAIKNVLLLSNTCQKYNLFKYTSEVSAIFINNFRKETCKINLNDKWQVFIVQNDTRTMPFLEKRKKGVQFLDPVFGASSKEDVLGYRESHHIA